jgi:hypothetical protein
VCGRVRRDCPEPKPDPAEIGIKKSRSLSQRDRTEIEIPVKSGIGTGIPAKKRDRDFGTSRKDFSLVKARRSSIHYGWYYYEKLLANMLSGPGRDGFLVG